VAVLWWNGHAMRDFPLHTIRENALKRNPSTLSVMTGEAEGSQFFSMTGAGYFFAP
jgi:hypothetical protein